MEERHDNAMTGRRWMKLAGWVIGLSLLVGMVVYSLASSAGAADWSRLLHAPAWLVATLLAAVGAQLFLSGLLFWVVTLSFDARPRVALGEMIGVITISALVNYLPMTGAVGRAAYMRIRHELPVRQSVIIQLVVIALSVLVSVTAVALVAIGQKIAASPGALVTASGVAFAALALAVSTLAAWALKRPVVVAGWAWVAVRVAELAVSSLRLWAAFAILGVDVGATQVVACSAAGFFVSLTGLTPNGLGLREWAVAAVSGWMTPEIGMAAAAAPLVDRAAEVVVFGIGGAVAGRSLGWRELKIMAARESA